MMTDLASFVPLPCIRQWEHDFLRVTRVAQSSVGRMWVRLRWLVWTFSFWAVRKDLYFYIASTKSSTSDLTTSNCLTENQGCISTALSSPTWWCNSSADSRGSFSFFLFPFSVFSYPFHLLSSTCISYSAHWRTSTPMGYVTGISNLRTSFSTLRLASWNSATLAGRVTSACLSWSKQ